MIKKLSILTLFTMIFTCSATLFAQEPTETEFKVVLFPFKEAVISSNIESYVDKYTKVEGERFKKGELLVKLDDSKYKQILQKATASYRERKATAEFYKKIFEGNVKLFHKGLYGKQDIARNKMDLEQAQSQEKGAAAEKNIAQINYDACTIEAPFPGRMVQHIVQGFEYVRPGQPMFSIIDDTQLLAVMNLPLNMLHLMKKGKEFKIYIDETSSVETGKVYQISPRADHNSGTFEVKLLLDNKNGHLLAGMSGWLQKQGQAANLKSKKQTAKTSTHTE